MSPLGGLLKLALAGAIALLWARGYLTTGISATIGAFSAGRQLRPIAIPGSSAAVTEPVGPPVDFIGLGSNVA